jgi:hypothetical protein
MEAYVGKQFVGIDLHGEQVKYLKVGWVRPRDRVSMPPGGTGCHLGSCRN